MPLLNFTLANPETGAADYNFLISFIDKFENHHNGRKREASENKNSENKKEENPTKRPRLSESPRTMSGNKFCKLQKNGIWPKMHSESENLNFLKLIYLIS